MARGKQKKEFMEFKSEWNMTQLDFKRLDEILKRIDEYYFQSSIGKGKDFIKYINSLKALYRYIRPLLKESRRKEYDGEIMAIRRLLTDGNKLDNSTFHRIEKLHDKLMDLRQFSGIGLFASPSIRDPTDKYFKDDIQ